MLNSSLVRDPLPVTNVWSVKNLMISLLVLVQIWQRKHHHKTCHHWSTWDSPWYSLCSWVLSHRVHKIINSLKNGAAGYDELSATILKMISSSITSPLAYFCNLSFDQGVFSKELKLANVIPLYKADDPCSFNNYRPISLLCVLTKVFEKVMYNRLVEYLDMLNILNDKQFGFRGLLWSCMALMALMDKLIDSLEIGEYVFGIFLDFSKAFDTVNHDIMLQKLSIMELGAQP